MVTLGQRLRELRKSKGLKREELADIIGAGPRVITFYETNDRDPSLKVLLALADYFDVSLDYLVGRSDDPGSLTTNKALDNLSGLLEYTNDMISCQENCKDSNILGLRLREIRTNAGLSCGKMARAIGLKSSGTITQFEKGNAYPSAKVLIRIALYFNVSVDYLLGLSNAPRPVQSHRPQKPKEAPRNEQ